MSAKKKMGKTKTKSKELTKAQLAKLPIKELRKHSLLPTPFSLNKLLRFFFNKKTHKIGKRPFCEPRPLER